MLRVLRLLLLLFGSSMVLFAQSAPHTPKPGSPERQSICDAARQHVIQKYATQPLPHPIVFHIDYIAVQGGYCFFEATPRFKDGSFVPPNYLPDMAYNFCLKNDGNRWMVILDLSRSDVPDASETADIRKRLPSDFPFAVFSPDWRKIFGESP
jgi:hypothetical protein